MENIRKIKDTLICQGSGVTGLWDGDEYEVILTEFSNGERKLEVSISGVEDGVWPWSACDTFDVPEYLDVNTPEFKNWADQMLSTVASRV